MTTRRRRFLGLLLGLGALLLAAAWLGSRGGRAEVKIVFLGFSNAPFGRIAASIPAGRTGTPPQVCVVLISNAGAVSLQFYGIDSSDELTSFRGITCHLEYETNMSRFQAQGALTPGQSARLQFFAPMGTNAFRRRFGFTPVGLRDRLSGLCQRVGWDYAAAKLYSPPNTNDLLWVSTGWITNTAEVLSASGMSPSNSPAPR